MFFQVPAPRARAASAEPLSLPTEEPTLGIKRQRTTELEVDDTHHPRNPRACDRCRVKKSRCLPDGRSCKRCKLEGAICTKSQASLTTPKFRTTPAYVQMLEGQRDTLVTAIRQLRQSGEAKSLDPALQLAVDRIEEIHRLETDESRTATNASSESPTSFVEITRPSVTRATDRSVDQPSSAATKSMKSQTLSYTNEADRHTMKGGISNELDSAILDGSMAEFAVDDWFTDFTSLPMTQIFSQPVSRTT